MNLGDRMKQADQREQLHFRVRRSLTNVTPTVEQINRIERVREAAKLLGMEIVDLCPLGREQSLALTHLEDAAMWAVKAIVLEEE